MNDNQDVPADIAVTWLANARIYAMALRKLANDVNLCVDDGTQKINGQRLSMAALRMKALAYDAIGCGLRLDAEAIPTALSDAANAIMLERLPPALYSAPHTSEPPEPSEK